MNMKYALLLFAILILNCTIVVTPSTSKTTIEPIAFTMSLNKDAFWSSIPIDSSKADEIFTLLVLYKNNEERFEPHGAIVLGSLKHLGSVIVDDNVHAMRPSSVPYSIVNILKKGQKENKPMNCVYYQSALTSDKGEHFDAIMMGTDRTDLREFLKKIPVKEIE